MSFGLLFWILMLGWLVLSAWRPPGTPPGTPYNYRPLGGALLLFVLLALLGWKQFGPALHP